MLPAPEGDPGASCAGLGPEGTQRPGSFMELALDLGGPTSILGLSGWGVSRGPQNWGGGGSWEKGWMELTSQGFAGQLARWPAGRVSSRIPNISAEPCAPRIPPPVLSGELGTRAQWTVGSMDHYFRSFRGSSS